MILLDMLVQLSIKVDVETEDSNKRIFVETPDDILEVVSVSIDKINLDPDKEEEVVLIKAK